MKRTVAIAAMTLTAVSMAASCKMIKFNSDKLGEKFLAPKVIISENQIPSMLTIDSLEFDAVELSGIFDVKYTPGPCQVRVVAAKEVIEVLEFSVKDKTLIVGTKVKRFNKTPDIDIWVSSPVLREVAALGAADFEAENVFGQGKFVLEVDGAGDIKIGNLTTDDNVYMEINGAGDIDIDRLQTKSFAAEINGAGDIDIDKLQAETFTAEVNGVGDVEVKGACGKADITINGVGSVDIGKLACPDVRSARNGMGRIIR